MNYLLFNNEILNSDGQKVQHLRKEDDLRSILGSIKEARICVVDVDVLIAAAVENPIEKKDSILVRKFKELYQHEAYVIQDEKIDSNLFQVMGIKEEKVREIYSLIFPQNVESFIPYGMALRNTLMNKKLNLNRTLVFIDGQDKERLITVFDGLIFSRTRVINNDGGDILPEIKRSQIDFFKKNEEYLSQKKDFVILINDRSLASDLAKNAENLSVEFCDIPYPALEGLREIGSPLKYVLPEEILKKRNEIELKKSFRITIFSVCAITVSLFYFLFNQLELASINERYKAAKEINERLDGELELLDKETYREDLRRQKSLNYGVAYLAILDLISPNYEIDSFKFTKLNNWDLELSLSSTDEAVYDSIPRIKILKNADIKDIFVNNQPGKRLKIIL